MTIIIPDEALGKLSLTEDQVRTELAIALFADSRVTLARASRIAGLARLDLQRELGRRRIPLHFGIADYEEDLRTVRAMK